MIKHPYDHALDLVAEHHREFGDDGLIEALSEAVASGHSDSDHLHEFADELHNQGHPHTARIAKAVAMAARGRRDV